MDEGMDEITIECDATATQQASQRSRRRTWNVRIEINGRIYDNVELSDPIPQEEYDTDIKSYITKSAYVLGGEHVDEDLLRLHVQVEKYRDTLLASLFKDSVRLEHLLLPDSVQGRINVHQIDPDRDSAYGNMDKPSCPSIHRLLWELLEHASLPTALMRPYYQFQVRRFVSLAKPRKTRSVQPKILRSLSFGSMRSSTSRLNSLRTWGPKATESSHYFKRLVQVKEPLMSVPQQPKNTFKVLLVLARKLAPRRVEPLQDVRIVEEERHHAGPDLAQWPLMRIQRELENMPDKNHLLLDIVRPGSLRELERHLEARAAQVPPVYFHVVHFDLHGTITGSKPSKTARTENIRANLRFLSPKENYLTSTPIHDIQRVLVNSKIRVENVVFNSCWSGYARHGRRANMCEILAKAGVKSVLGMAGLANDRMLPDFLEYFYRGLFVDYLSFDEATISARKQLRQDKQRWKGCDSFADDFICVQYTRGPIPVRQEVDRNPRRSGHVIVLYESIMSLFRSTPLRNLPSFSETQSFPKSSASGQGSIHHYGTRPRARSSGSTRRSAREPPKLIKLECLFLKLEIFLMDNPYVFAKSRLPSQEESIAEMRNLAYLWQKTNFVRKLIVLNAESFEWDADPRAELILPGSNGIAPPRDISRVLYVIENTDRAVAGINRDAGAKEAVKKNLERFLNNVDWSASYVIITTQKAKRWWETQEWTGTQSGQWWSFSQQGQPSHLTVPNP